MARRARDDPVSTRVDRVMLEAAQPRIEAAAIQLLFTAREIAPACAAFIGEVRAVEQRIVRKPGLTTVVIEAGRPAGDLLRLRLKGSWFNCTETEIGDCDP